MWQVVILVVVVVEEERTNHTEGVMLRPSSLGLSDWRNAPTRQWVVQQQQEGRKQESGWTSL